MSDDARCEFCKKDGRRPRMHPCPKDWFYMEAVDDDNPKDVIIITVCSKECALALFQRGPGPRWTYEELMNA
jgi:hypothetical protein